LLLGGGFAMAAAIESSGLSRWLAEQLAQLRTLAPFGQILVASLVTVTLSAFASNAATIAVMLGVLADSVSPAHSTSVLFAATIAASCDFALPAGTPPNAIVFGSGYVSIPRMARTGVLLVLSNNAAAVVLAPICLGVASHAGIDPKPLLIAVTFGASASFATPIGYQTNTMVMGPGGYFVRDFLRVGVPLNLLMAVAATILIPLFWEP
jgi:di/tricarboxylate transporter